MVRVSSRPVHVGLLAVVSGFSGQASLRASDIAAYALRGRVALPTAGAFQDMFDALPDGRLVVLAANDVHIEVGAGARRFIFWGALTGDGAPIVYPAFIRVSPDGTRFTVGNSFDAVGVFTFSDGSGVWFNLPHYEAEWYDEVQLAIRAGGDVALLDTTSDPKHPINPLIVTGGPVSAGLTFDRAGNLYTGTGLTGGGPSETGWVKGFSGTRWQGVLSGDPPIDYETEGTLICDLLSAASLGFDEADNLHVGGGDFDTGDVDYAGLVSAEAVKGAWAGKGPADGGDPREVRAVDPDAGNEFNWYDATYNAATHEWLVRDAWTSSAFVYAQPAGISCEELTRFRARCGAGGKLRARVRLTNASHHGAVLYVAVDDAPYRAFVEGRVARWRAIQAAVGEHVVALTDPAVCVDSLVVICP
ncbi:MAG: hypothetical protein IT449_14160 [Phycisphaerales bacterium]|nr:hypothetical protein [Phycisphaerales bacterium]